MLLFIFWQKLPKQKVLLLRALCGSGQGAVAGLTIKGGEFLEYQLRCKLPVCLSITGLQAIHVLTLTALSTVLISVSVLNWKTPWTNFLYPEWLNLGLFNNALSTSDVLHVEWHGNSIISNGTSWIDRNQKWIRSTSFCTPSHLTRSKTARRETDDSFTADTVFTF